MWSGVGGTKDLPDGYSRNHSHSSHWCRKLPVGSTPPHQFTPAGSHPTVLVFRARTSSCPLKRSGLSHAARFPWRRDYCLFFCFFFLFSCRVQQTGSIGKSGSAARLVLSWVRMRRLEILLVKVMPIHSIVLIQVVVLLISVLHIE